ncbi:MAG: nucleotidyl transferase AbiEii/AbiGii toxin family protein [Leptonema sp. (in: Bacteria)]|nr:nucleotidyl transferase AbiEii/AbiGii toxin family protein [Leptonema sp. (in: bacteria)]
MVNHLEEILGQLSDRGVRFIICGGVAVVLQGVERMTMDLDLSLDMEKENVTKFLEALRELNLTPRAPVPAETILDPELRDFIVKEKNAVVFSFIDNDNPYRQVDVMLIQEGNYNRLLEESETIELAGRPIRIMSREGLIRMKKELKNPREKDLHDIRQLKKLVEEG